MQSQLSQVANGVTKLFLEVSHILKTWQQRLPNPWDDIYHWGDLLRWRQHVYSLITDAYKSDPTVDKTLGHKDTAWSIHKFAQIARYQGLPELCLSTLREVEDVPHLSVPQAYSILREQLLCYLDMPRFYKVGLKIINKTNLDAFEPNQKVMKHSSFGVTNGMQAELCYLKGEFYRLMGFHEASEKSYATALVYYKEFDQAWIGWGKYWDLQSQIYDTLDPHKSKECMQHAVNCYLQGIKCNNHETRNYLTRVLWMASTSEVCAQY